METTESPKTLRDAFEDAHWSNPFSAVSRTARNVVDVPEIPDSAYLDYMAGGGHHFGGTVTRQGGFVTVTVYLD